MLLEITQKGMDYWDDNRSETAYAEQISVGAKESEKDHGLFVLGVMYGAGAEDPSPLIDQDPKWRRIIANLVEAKFLQIVEVEE